MYYQAGGETKLSGTKNDLASGGFSVSMATLPVLVMVWISLILDTKLQHNFSTEYSMYVQYHLDSPLSTEALKTATEAYYTYCTRYCGSPGPLDTRNAQFSLKSDSQPMKLLRFNSDLSQKRLKCFFENSDPELTYFLY